MALKTAPLRRIFKHGDTTLEDPDVAMTPEDVMAFYSNTYPELTTASVSGPEIKDGTAEYAVRAAEYKFDTHIGGKG